MRAQGAEGGKQFPYVSQVCRSRVVGFEVITRNCGKGDWELSAVDKGFKDFGLSPDAPRFCQLPRPRR